jgi:hypothetical protein
MFLEMHFLFINLPRIMGVLPTKIGIYTKDVGETSKLCQGNCTGHWSLENHMY